MTAYWLTGETRRTMAALPPGCVDLILTSPPFLALRSYLPADHADKADEMGSEGTPGAFLDALLDVTEVCRRVLAPHGTLAVELGDTYSGSGGSGGDYAEDGLRAGQPKVGGSTAAARSGKPTLSLDRDRYASSDHRPGWPLAKSLTLIPESYRWALVYGRNPHTGRTTPPWRARNVVRWARPNPPVGALGDKFRPATSDLVVACTARDRWFDLDAVRQPHAHDYTGTRPRTVVANPAGAPPLDHWWHDEDVFTQDAWNIPTHGYPGSHYATFPAALCVTPIEAMCPRRVCTTCGAPSRRLVDGQRIAPADDGTRRKTGGTLARSQDRPPEVGWEYERTTTGWSSCGCPGTDGLRLDGYHTGTGWRPGIVLDPFAGSGTTLAVATGHGRHAIGIDLDARNADLARERIGMWLVETTAAELAGTLTPRAAA